ncbi:MbtH family protein [Cohnella fermenti]|uniref:MbtH family NRPS accessory protein n=1 Tax=Cohnella fermenti TaxID=2565925 RepID=A0A4S4BNS9_9BACL|nr:MbtH family NRPS accessory protein [Cohnella fermenti]THF76534.1 MbtH family NRPS accessory protein [Cohnella fermenti]
MSNPFEATEDKFYALANAQGQYSLWPAFAEIPAGWTKLYEAEREACLAYIEEHWTDMRPQPAAPQAAGV